MIKFLAPGFWQQRLHPLALMLWPLGELYKFITHQRLRHAAPRVSIPVICIGNATAGGSGKTPIVQYTVQQLQSMGRSPHILLRGYGGLVKEAMRVDSSLHDAQDVGDEALLHAAIAPTWVGRDRFLSAQAAIAAGADVIVMDDGMQNITIAPSARWLVVDGVRGFGNGFGIPAGPMREDFNHALRRADAMIVASSPANDKAARMVISERTSDHTFRDDIPVLRVSVHADESSRALLKDKLIYAFAGIGHPEKLAVSLRAAGLEVAGVRGFPDHHPYSEKEINALRQRAKLLGAQLVTTKKDFVRLPDAWRADIIPVDVNVVWQEPELFRKILQDAVHGKN